MNLLFIIKKNTKYWTMEVFNNDFIVTIMIYIKFIPKMRI